MSRLEEPGEPPAYFSPEMGEGYAEFWNRTAATPEGALYGVAGYPFGKPPTEHTVSWQGLAVARFVAEHLFLSPTDEVLEIGVGVGRLAQHLAPLSASYWGADVSANMLVHAARRLAHVPNLRLKLLETCDLRAFESERFDKVFFQHMLIHLDPEEVFNYLREARRVLKPGGLAYFQFYNLLHAGGFREFLHAADQVILQGGKQRGAVRCHTAEEARFLIEKAGLAIAEESSHLQKVEQDFRWIPDPDWRFYLIAVAGR